MFRAGEQWPLAIRRDRENENQDGGPRPCPVLDKTNQYVRQVVNEERQNRAAIKIRPVDDKSDPKTAEIITLRIDLKLSWPIRPLVSRRLMEALGIGVSLQNTPTICHSIRKS